MAKWKDERGIAINQTKDKETAAKVTTLSNTQSNQTKDDGLGYNSSIKPFDSLVDAQINKPPQSTKELKRKEQLPCDI